MNIWCTGIFVVQDNAFQAEQDKYFSVRYLVFKSFEKMDIS